MNLTFEEFKEKLVENKHLFLPEALMDAELSFRTNEKLNRTYEAMLINIPGEAAVPVINIQERYENAGDKSFEEVAEELATVVNTVEMDHVRSMTGNLDLLKDYEQVKNQLFIRASNEPKNRAYLEDCPSMVQGDIAYTVHVGMDWKADGAPEGSITVNNALLDNWGVDKDTLFQDAIVNAAERLPVRFTTLNRIMEEIMGMPPNALEDDGMPLHFLGTEAGSYGAAVALYDGVLDQVYAELGEFYLLPSSVHELLVLPVHANADLAELESMVQEINRTEVATEDQLSDQVYHYDGKTLEFAKQVSPEMEHTRDYVVEQQMDLTEEIQDYEPEVSIGLAM